MSQNDDSAAKALLDRLGQHGIRFLFANSGTDFASVIEAYESASQTMLSDWPRPLTIPHENLAVGMAHGAFLATGEVQAVMVHVNVGLANAVMGLINARSDEVPLVMLAGRTPLTAFQRHGARMTPIQYGQEMYDQSAMVREVTKWDYELRYGEQTIDAVDRAVQMATSSPMGPVFLGLPREPLAEPITGGRRTDHVLPARLSPPGTTPAEIEWLADKLMKAKTPLIICQRGGAADGLGQAIADFAERYGVAIVEPFAIHNLIGSDHPCHLGYQLGGLLEDSDLIMVIESPVPWIQRFTVPPENACIVHVGADPLQSHLPMHNFPASRVIAANATEVLNDVKACLDRMECPPERLTDRRSAIEMKVADERSRRATVMSMAKVAKTISPALLGDRLTHHLDVDTLVFSEMGPPLGFVRPRYGKQWHCPPYSGGLGWGVPAALGAKLADRTKRVVACVGDGSYIFANPLACHQVAAALEVPILIIILNNGSWNATRRAVNNMYGDGQAAAKENPVLTDLSPAPNLEAMTAVFGGNFTKVEHPANLDEALNNAFRLMDQTSLTTILEVVVTKTDGF